MKTSKSKSKSKTAKNNTQKAKTGTMKKIAETGKRREKITFPEVRDLGYPVRRCNQSLFFSLQ